MSRIQHIAVRMGAGAAIDVLLIEDDTETAVYVTEVLYKQGFSVSWAPTGTDGLYQAQLSDFDLLIVDRMLPGMDGLTIVQTLRARSFDMPVLFLTTMSGLDDRVEGLAAGGDDYLSKPFALSELVARVQAILRRTKRHGVQTALAAGPLRIDLLRREVTRDGARVELQPQEFRLLEYLMQNAGRTVTRTMLLENVWNLEFDPGTNIVESHISRLRAKIGRGFDGDMIRTVRGAGYVLCD